MAPPTSPLHIDVEAISGICGSISIACWIVVFSPQIIENFRRSSADGLSLQFVITWLAGDVFNILGAVLQRVLPTMLIIAVYYCLADTVMLAQCFYYRGFTWRDDDVLAKRADASSRKTLRRRRSSSARGLNGNGHRNGGTSAPDETTRLLGADWPDRLTHLNPTVPIVDPAAAPAAPASQLQTLAWNALAVIAVIAAGVIGWVLSREYSSSSSSSSGNNDSRNDAIEFDVAGQIFGWLCAALYLGSRLPQLLLNWRRKSTEGVSVLFFLFASLGNLTYVLSIFAFEPPSGTAEMYWRYILVNLSWLAGSAGTLLLDMGILTQFFMYRRDDGDGDEYDGGDDDVEGAEGGDDGAREVGADGERWDQRPILERNQSDWSN